MKGRMPPFINRFLLLLSRRFRRIYIFVRLDSQRRTRRANHLKNGIPQGARRLGFELVQEEAGWWGWSGSTLLMNEGGRRDTRGSLEIAEWDAHRDGDRRQKVMKPRGAESECQFVENARVYRFDPLFC
jgi:hypothetical protein